MTPVGIVGVALLNGAPVWFFSIFAVAGGGDPSTSGDGVYLLRWLGYSWIVVCTVAALVLSSKGRASSATMTAVLTLPTGFVLLGVGMTLVGAFQHLRPNSTEFRQLCANAGATFLAAPSAPVTSLAYDWTPGTLRPQFRRITLGFLGRINSRGISTEPYPPSIVFIERRQPNDVGQYLRETNDGKVYGRPLEGVAALSADALVWSEYGTVWVAGLPFVQFDVKVSDRRDQKLLATLRYFTDPRRRRACGATSEGLIDEQAFVIQAVSSL